MVKLKYILSLLVASTIFHSSIAQDNKVKVDLSDMKDLGNGLMYKLVKDAPGTLHPVVGGGVEIHLQNIVDDSLIYSSRQAFDGRPSSFKVPPVQYEGDVLQALMLMTPGDSAVIAIPVDSLMAHGQPEMPWMRRNSPQKLVYTIVLASVISPEQLQREEEAKRKNMEEMQRKAQEDAAAHAAKQGPIDDKLITDYLKEHKIKTQKTEQGLYYKITKEGDGAQPQPGQQVYVMYTGKLLNGNVFDSNMDPKYGHTDPFDFKLGEGRVIKGWDIGIGLLKKGTKATLYIPSTLAYGQRAMGPDIPANSVLIFDVELTDIK